MTEEIVKADTSAGQVAQAGSTAGDAMVDFGDAELKAAMFRALRLTAAAAAVIFAVLLVAKGWRTAAMLLAGAVVSASGLWEWQKLIGVINAELDGGGAKTPSAGRVVAGFFVRLVIAGAILYGSLKLLHGSVYALVAGLMLGVAALAFEAVRLIKA